jgi:fatty acid desaturase
MTGFFCKYKNVFGEPGTGAHKYRFWGIAIVDALLTILVAYIFAYFTKWPIWISLGGFFLLGIFVHRLFCVRTTVDKLLFGK